MKDFILLGPKTSCQYQDMFWRIVEHKIHIGYTHPDTFTTADETKYTLTNWYNNIGVFVPGTLIPRKTYDPEKYPAYDNYPGAINVDRVKDIPGDYRGVMGVPISILDKVYDDYEIVGLNNDSRTKDFKYLVKGTPLPDKNGVPRFGFFVDGEQVYTRILIKKI